MPRLVTFQLFIMPLADQHLLLYYIKISIDLRLARTKNKKIICTVRNDQASETDKIILRLQLFFRLQPTSQF